MKTPTVSCGRPCRWTVISWPIRPPLSTLPDLHSGCLWLRAMIVAFRRCPTKSTLCRSIMLATAAFFAGPLIGGVLAAMAIMFGDVHPLDRVWMLQSFAIIGTVAGVIGGVMIALFTCIGASNPRISNGRTKAQTASDNACDVRFLSALIPMVVLLRISPVCRPWRSHEPIVACLHTVVAGGRIVAM